MSGQCVSVATMTERCPCKSMIVVICEPLQLAMSQSYVFRRVKRMHKSLGDYKSFLHKMSKCPNSKRPT